MVKFKKLCQQESRSYKPNNQSLSFRPAFTTHYKWVVKSMGLNLQSPLCFNKENGGFDNGFVLSWTVNNEISPRFVSFFSNIFFNLANFIQLFILII